MFILQFISGFTILGLPIIYVLMISLFNDYRP